MLLHLQKLALQWHYWRFDDDLRSAFWSACRIKILVCHGQRLPFTDSLSETNERFGTPQWSIILTGVAMGVCILTLPVKDVAKLASGFQIMVIVALNACVIVLRRDNPKHDWYKPTFKSPLFPFIQIFGIIAGASLVYLMGTKALIGAVAALVLGFSSYKIYGERNYNHSRNDSESE